MVQTDNPETTEFVRIEDEMRESYLDLSLIHI